MEWVGKMPSVMIAEDDLLVADMLEETLTQGGYDVCGIARTVDKAVELGERHRPDLAILDIRLAEGGLGTEVLPRLTSAGHMGILYASGYALPSLTKADGMAVIRKPYQPDEILRAIKIVEQIALTGNAPQPFPARFHVLNGASEDGPAPTVHSDPPDSVARILRQQAALARFGSFAFLAPDVHSVLTEAARVCAEGLDAGFCKICRYRPEENDLLVEAGVGWHQGMIGQVVSQADDSSPQGRAFTTRAPVICRNLAKELTFVPPAFYADHGIVSTVDVIIPGVERPYGILEVDSASERIFDETDITFLKGFANVVAGAVEAARRKTADAAIIAEKDRLLTIQRALLNEKSLLARELNHRVRNNLQLIHGMLAREGNNGNTPAIARRVMTMSQIYDRLLGTGLTQRIAFDQYLKDLCASHTDMELGSHSKFVIGCKCDPVTADLDTVSALGLAVSELIANSIQHAFPDRTGLISVSLGPDSLKGGGLELTISDDGVGFEETEVSKRQGIGLVRRLLEQIGGTATRSSDHGTKWLLKVPKTPDTIFISNGAEDRATSQRDLSQPY